MGDFTDRLRKISDNLGEISGKNTPRMDDVFTKVHGEAFDRPGHRNVLP